MKKLVAGLVLGLSLNVHDAPPPAPVVDKPAPEFKAQGSNGVKYDLKKLKGKVVVLEWFNKDCPFVRKFYKSNTMQDLQKEATKTGDPGAPPVVWLTIASSAKGKQGHLTEAEAKKIHDQFGMMSTAVIADSGSKIASLYHAKTTPSFYIIDPKGNVAYQGAIDDQPSADVETLKGAHNYVREALGALANGREVKEKSKTPYGCSVKY